MEPRIRPLTASDMPEVRRLYLDGFSNSAYYAAVEPDESKRTEMFDREVMPQALCCVRSGASYCCEADGSLCAMMLIAEITKERANILDEIFFGFYRRINDKETLAGRKALLDAVEKHGRAAYFFSAAVDKRYRRRHIGIRLIKHCLDLFQGMYIFTELTTPEMFSLFKAAAKERKLVQNKISGHYVITAVEP